MLTSAEYETKIQIIYKQWKECRDPESKKILEIRGKLLRSAQNLCKKHELSNKVPEKTPEELAKPIDSDKVYDVAKMIFG